MKAFVTIFTICLFSLLLYSSNSGAQEASALRINYFGDSIIATGSLHPEVSLQYPATEKQMSEFYAALNRQPFQPLIDQLLTYKQTRGLDDWLFYQLIRRTAQQLSPKEENYEQYTMYKWFLLVKSGYDARLAFAGKHLLFYVQSNDNIYDIPLFAKDGKQYVCLNIHDTGPIDFTKDELTEIQISKEESATKAFSYRVTQIPDLRTQVLDQKKLRFEYKGKWYEYAVNIDPQMQNMFNNYPSVDFEAYFNIPMSRSLYSSLIPVLQKKLKGKKQEYGIDYLMRFTRNAFMYEDDKANFGTEKRLSPEQTVMNQFSDCDDRAALFYYLVKEIYNLPMIVLVYPSHITLAIELRQPVGVPVVYKGRKFSVCEPTPQKLDLPLGKLMPELKHTAYQVAFEYLPGH